MPDKSFQLECVNMFFIRKKPVFRENPKKERSELIRQIESQTSYRVSYQGNLADNIPVKVDPSKHNVEELLADALVRFLLEKPDATALVIGGHSEWVRDRAVHTHPELEARFQAKPAMPPDQLRPYYRESRIMAIPSGVESGPIVAFEAVCCGCSIVFGRELNHLQMFSEAGVGTMAKAWNSSRAFAEAQSIQLNASVTADGKIANADFNSCLNMFLRYTKKMTVDIETEETADGHFDFGVGVSLHIWF